VSKNEKVVKTQFGSSDSGERGTPPFLAANCLGSLSAPEEGVIVGFTSSSFAKVELKLDETINAIKQYLKSLCITKILP
jgi:hypothetical protein